MSASMCRDAAALRDYLRGVLPEAELVDSELHLVPELRLWLMNPDYPVGRLPGASLQALLAAPPYWAFCWGSGAVLARWLLDHPNAVRGSTVVDFGAGSGIVAIAAARCGARRVVACDLDARALAAARWNALHNGVVLETCDDFFAVEGDVDVVVAADVLYDRDNLTFLEAFRERAARVMLSDSRVRDLSAPGYERVWAAECRVAPDLFEEASVNAVTVYASDGRASRGPKTDDDG